MSDDVTVVIEKRGEWCKWRVVIGGGGEFGGGEWTVTNAGGRWRVHNWLGRELFPDRPTGARAIAAVRRFEEQA